MSTVHTAASLGPATRLSKDPCSSRRNEPIQQRLGSVRHHSHRTKTDSGPKPDVKLTISPPTGHFPFGANANIITHFCWRKDNEHDSVWQMHYANISL